MNKRQVIFFILFILQAAGLHAQDSTLTPAGEKRKTGWTFGTLPVLSYNTDMGLRYGWLVNFYDYGKGHVYPFYDHSIYLEASRTTKGGGIYQIQVDSRKLLKGWRTMLDAGLFTEQGLDFFGFNGYQAWYNPAFIQPGDPAYISRVFYRIHRNMYHISLSAYKSFFIPSFRWFAGIEYSHILIHTVDIHSLNKGLSGAEELPDTFLLYDHYVAWGIIRPSEKNGGDNTLIKTGVIYDTRNEEANPSGGVWSELQLLGAPSFLCSHPSYLRLAFTHRQYVSLVPEKLSFAGRISWQGKLLGQMPFYMLPFIYNTVPNYTRDGLGGYATLRGIMRNRIAGEDYVYGNLEIRWKFFRTLLWKQNLYLALSAFADGGMVTRPYSLNAAAVPEEYRSWISYRPETLHVAFGGGLRIALNNNFIVAVDTGVPLNPQDGKTGVYIFLGWLF